MLGIDKLLPKKKVSDMLPWIAACGDNRTIYTKAGGFLQVAKVEARPLDAASWPAIDTYYDQLAALEGRADDGWTFFHDRWKWQRDANLPMCSFGGNRAAQLIDWAERTQFAEDKAFDRTLFMALHYEPEHARAGLAQWLVGRDTAFSESAELVRFREQIEKFWAELWHIVPQVTLLEGSYDPRLKGDALGSYLSMVANYEATSATLPWGRIDRGLGTSRWVSGTDPFVPHQYIPPTHLKIGRRHIRTVEVYSIGAITADTLRELDQLEYENRVVVRVDATARHRQTKWLAQLREECAQNRQSPFRRVLGWFTRKDEGDSNPAAAYQAAEAEQLRADVMLGDAGFAPITMTVRVWHEDPAIADRRALDVEVKLKNLGFRAEQSDLSAALSVLADVPGRDPEPREIPSPYIQLIRLAPIAGASIGSKADGKWDGPALLLGYGEKGPVRFAWHGPGEDNGNTAIVGQSGSGKSSLLAKLVAATLKYDGARVVVFDLGRAFMPTCLCLGGDWRELGRGTACVQPLRHIDVPEQAILIHDWLTRAVQHQGVRRTHETDHAIHSAMRLVARLPVEKRTMSGLVARLGASADVREALRSFTGEGQWGEIFDGVVESHGSGCVMGREVGGIRDAAILPLLVSAVFDALRFEMLSTGAPSLVVFDEFHALVQRAAFRGEVDRLAREIRKLNGVMVLATQSPAELTEDLAAVVVDQCPNLIFAANPDVLDENTARWYRQLGCTDEELDLIATGYQKRDYFFRTRQYRARLAIRLEDDAATICGHTSPLDIQMCRQLVADGVTPGEEFLERWQAYVAAKQERRDRAA